MRDSYTENGVFGVLWSDDGSFSCQTLEHAYLFHDGILPKLPVGIYICKRGMHQLEGMTKPFETFEITNVPKHTDILFHTGNVNADSSGCVLVGAQRIEDKEILGSRAAFAALMDHLKYVDTFELAVS
jgi:hypothetical protein